MTTHIVTRAFRGNQLFLSAVHAGAGFHWVADRSAAMRVSHTDAMALVAKAARHWGADCAALDAIGQLSQPAEAVKPVAPYRTLTRQQILRHANRMEVLRASEDEDARDDYARKYLEPAGYTPATWDAAVSAVREVASHD